MKDTIGKVALIQLWYEKYKKILVVLVLILAIFIFGEITLPTGFLSIGQILITAKLASFTALFGLCQMIVIAGGGEGLDLSVGYNATLTAVVTASIMNGSNGNLWLAVLVALGFGIAIGMANGALASYLRLPPLVVTLAMADILQGIVNAYVAGKAITGRPSPILTLMAAKSTGEFPNILFVLIPVAVLATIAFNNTKWGQILFGVGANERTAYLSGINVKKVRFAAFTVSGTLASLVGLLLLGNMGIAFKDMGSNYVLPSIAAVVLGGVPLSGGGGNYLGVIMGAIFLQALTNLLVAFGLGDAAKWVTFGIILFVMLSFYASNVRRR
ncbi:ABC transporter permease [Atrimonas thermophila]|uniref:ABC transporter permease n=1 Tax=Atrimonas thermophila TaxID=3064161 RepID=UPI00399D3F5B